MKENLDNHQVDRSIIDFPNLHNEHENNIRRMILKKTRGYDDSLIFTKFPKGVSWKIVRLTIAELIETRYLRSDPWVMITKGSLAIRDTISTLPEYSSDNNLREIETIIDYSSNLRIDPKGPLMILVSSDSAEELIILEGCVRATAYCNSLEGSYEIEAILGISSGITDWNFY